MFTEAESRLVKSAVIAAIRVDDAQVQLGNAVIADTGGRDVLAHAATQTVRAARDTSLVAALLLGGAPPEYEERPGVPYRYPALAALAWEHMRRAAAETLPAARKSMAAVPGPGAEMLAEADSRLGAILAAAVPEAFFHADPPFEPARSDGSARRVFGPHGDYRLFQRHNLSSYNYWHDFAEQWVAHYRDRAVESRQAFGEAWRTYAASMTIQLQAAALAAGVSTYWKWDAYDHVCRVLTAHDLLTMAAEGEGAAQLYASCLMAWAETSDDSEAFRSGTKRHADSQRHCWRAAREMMPIPGRCP